MWEVELKLQDLPHRVLNGLQCSMERTDCSCKTLQASDYWSSLRRRKYDTPAHTPITRNAMTKTIRTMPNTPPKTPAFMVHLSIIRRPGFIARNIRLYPRIPAYWKSFKCDVQICCESYLCWAQSGKAKVTQSYSKIMLEVVAIPGDFRTLLLNILIVKLEPHPYDTQVDIS